MVFHDSLLIVTDKSGVFLFSVLLAMLSTISDIVATLLSTSASNSLYVSLFFQRSSRSKLFIASINLLTFFTLFSCVILATKSSAVFTFLNKDFVHLYTAGKYGNVASITAPNAISHFVGNLSSSWAVNHTDAIPHSNMFLGTCEANFTIFVAVCGFTHKAVNAFTQPLFATCKTFFTLVGIIHDTAFAIAGADTNEEPTKPMSIMVLNVFDVVLFDVSMLVEKNLDASCAFSGSAPNFTAKSTM